MAPKKEKQVKIAVVQLDAEGREVDHLALGENTLTLCGNKWTHRTRREGLNDDRYETQCYRCQQEARVRVIRSLEGALLLTRWAGLDWKMMCNYARVVI